jgi:hypothetical protein
MYMKKTTSASKRTQKASILICSPSFLLPWGFERLGPPGEGVEKKEEAT